MEQDTLETLPIAASGAEGDNSGKPPFAGENRETRTEERFDSRELPLSSDPKLCAVQEKFLRGESLSPLEKIYDRDGAAITTNIDGYELKTDHAYRAVSKKLYNKYVQDGVITRDIDEYIAGHNNGGVDWYLGGAAAATRKYGDRQDNIVVLECPADKDYFSLTVDNGNGMVIDPRIRHIKSSSREHPVPMNKITRVFYIDHSGQTETLDNVGIARAKVLGALKGK